MKKIFTLITNVFACISSCYHIEAERVTWTEAKTMCMAIDSDLVAIETQSEHNYIVEHLKKSKSEYIVFFQFPEII